MTDQEPTHRKRVKHYHEPGHIHELTFSCYKRLPLLTNDHWRSLLAHSLDRATNRHQYRLCAFVFMPEHVHLLVYPEAAPAGVDQLLRAIKRPFSLRIKRLLKEAGSGLLDRLTVRQRPGVTTFRFWQKGPGYDRNLTEVPTTLTAIDYIHLNPVRRGLVQSARDWRWSSARMYENPQGPKEHGLPTIEFLPADWLNQPSR
jgi:putative transposase